MMVDVIIPTFNRSHLLNRAIDSVLHQEYQNFNLFISDDGSTDDTLAVVAPYLSDSRVHYLKQENKGVSAARNLAIKNSNSLWLAFLDSDDEWLPQKLLVQIDFISKNPEYRFIHSNEIWIRNGLRVNPKTKFDKSGHEIFKRSLQTCLISPSTVMMKRDLCQDYGLFNEEFAICEDYDLWLKILAHEEVGHINEYLIKKHGGHNDQLSTRYPAMDHWRIKSMATLLKNNNLSQEKRELILTEINKKAPILLKGFLKYGNYQEHEELTNLLTSL
jgi:glycosyltransferase involved in cell wall biosynthesis